MKTLNINTAKVGDKVIFAYPNNGYPMEQERALQHLVVGKEYTIKFVDINDWSSVVCLDEIPRPLFNSVLFGVEEDETSDGDCQFADGSGGFVSVENATMQQLKDEVKRLISLMEDVDSKIYDVASAVNAWRAGK